MGVWEWLRKKAEKPTTHGAAGRETELAETKRPAPALSESEEAKIGQCLEEIARIIAPGDEEAWQAVRACANDPEAFFAAHCITFDERCIDDASDRDKIRWLGLVDILEERGHVCERDWKEEKVDFLYFVGQLSGIAQSGLSLDAAWLEEEGDIPAWCAVIDAHWKEAGAGMACIDIDSDSYVLFPCQTAAREKLEHLAAKIGHRIAPARDM